MLGLPMDGLLLWIALGTVSVTAAGVALGLPTAAGPDAGRVADAVDRVAASPFDATATVSLAADRLRLGSSRLALRRAGRTNRAAFATGPVRPVQEGPLRRVLTGARPEAVFESEADFAAALASRPPGLAAWRDAPDRLHVRRATWGETDVTLVG